MTERNLIGGVTASVLSPFVDGWESLMVWMVVAFTLILADLRFGIMAARKRREVIRGSRAVRRTINKMVDYICWVSIAYVLGGSFGRIFDVPLLASIVMLIVCAIELSSIFDNYFEYKGLKKKFNIWRFYTKMFKIPDLEDVIEDADDQEKKMIKENESAY